VKRFLTIDNALAALLLCVPIALVLDFGLGVGGTPVFLLSALAIVPLAGYMGRATERLAEHVGAGLGGLLNATFGNAAELIIALFALRAGLQDVVKASLTGSIIGNVLLVFGLSALLGGLRHPFQRFNRTAASLGATMLVLSAIGLVIPAIFHEVAGASGVEVERNLSLDISVVLIVTYVLSLVFSLRTHPQLYAGGAREAGGRQAVNASAGGETASASGRSPVVRAFLLLAVSAAFVGLMSEVMVGALEQATRELGMTEVFVGVVLVALVGNAAEHSTAVLVAMKDKMDLAVGIAVGSSIQIALFVAPVLVFASYVLGPEPMDLRFTPLEVVAVTLSVGIMALVAQDGESHWMEGVQLLAVYLMLALAFFFLPV
jgi:Ca2+:H+ antiporter